MKIPFTHIHLRKLPAALVAAGAGVQLLVLFRVLTAEQGLHVAGLVAAATAFVDRVVDVFAPPALPPDTEGGL